MLQIFKRTTAMVKLYIKDHCIETAAKQEFKRLMDNYFESDNETGLIEEKIEILREFIEKADFGQLRGSDPRLAGETESDVYLKKENNRIKIVFSE